MIDSLSRRWLQGLLGLYCLACWPGMPAYPEPAAAYDEQRYVLAYNIYLASGQLAAAYGLAHKALRVHPQDRVWLQRYIQLARWLGDGPAALSALLRLSALQPLDAGTWKQIGVMARQLDNDRARLVVQLHDIDVHGADHERVQAAISSYERLGDIDSCIAWLLRLQQQQPDPWWLQQASTLAEREGRTRLSESLLEELLRHYPAQPEWLVSLATLDYGQGEVAKALQDLRAYQRQMPATAQAYWEVLGDFSHLLGHDAEALQAYQVLISAGQARDHDMDMAVELLSAHDMLAAAQLSTLNAQQHPADARLLNALYLNNRVHHEASNVQLLRGLSAADRQRLHDNPEFLAQLAVLDQALGRPQDAITALQRATRLAPEQERYMAQLIDAFIQAQDWRRLRACLMRANPYARRHPGLWLSWASAWQTLHEPRHTRPWLRAWLRGHPDDLHARLQWADVFENLGQTMQAGRIRRQVLMRADHQALSADEMRVLRWQVAHDGAPDAYYKKLLYSLRQGSTAQQQVALERLLDAQIETGASDERLAGAAPMALSLRVYRALHDQDGAAMPALLQAPDLAAGDRRALLMASGQRDRAEQALLEAAWANPDDPDLAAAWAPLLGRAAALSSGYADKQIGILSQHAYELGTSWPLDAARRLELGWTRIDQRSLDTTQLLQAPSEKSLSLRYVEDLQRGRASLAWVPTVNAGHYAELDAAVQYPLSSRLNIDAQLHDHEPANENELLIALGRRDQAQLTTTYALSPLWQLQAAWHQYHYATQTGESLGDGAEHELAVTRQLLAPLDVSLEYTQYLFQPASQPLDKLLATAIPQGQLASTAAILPASFTQWTMNAHWQDQPTYGRHWRLIADAAWLYTSSAGRGYAAHMALAGPLAGRDELTLDLMQERSGLDQGSLVRTLAIRYRYVY